ncbi:DUF7916 family protein [Bacillus massilinigeriensis]|uniref:DUF7916 family protein n=1 Tax=Bacillus massilionigeriensis TaxID=1805475 RepID=UPI00096B0907|nr:PEP phosphonomutase [Bacillus massilionigeriensis]
MKRFLNCTASDFKKMNGSELKIAIEASEGRTMMAEIICTATPLYPGLTNAEYVSAFGADMVLLNFFDVNHPYIEGLEDASPNDLIDRLKDLIGRPVGINLEPVDENAEQAETLAALPKGRMASAASLKKAKELGVDFVCLTGNPKTGVTNKEIIASIKIAKEILGDDVMIIAGKMHGAGVKGEAGGNIVSEEIVKDFVEAGTDVILLPGVGTVPGVTIEMAAKLTATAQSLGALVMSTIGTSQEGADEATIRQIALQNKMAGVDIHHIGDAGVYGMAIPENILAYSIAIRGRRHTYSRMAASILR